MVRRSVDKNLAMDPALVNELSALDILGAHREGEVNFAARLGWSFSVMTTAIIAGKTSMQQAMGMSQKKKKNQLLQLEG